MLHNELTNSISHDIIQSYIIRGGNILEERIKLVRKTLNLSQSSFGKALGVSRDVINNIERARNKTPVADMFISHLCSVYKVNEEWLRTGAGKMFVDDNPSNNKQTNLKKLSCSALQILKDFHELSPKEQSDFIQQAEKIISNLD